MPVDVSELERGVVCLALYPFTPGFPLDSVLRDGEDQLLAQLERFDSIEEIETTLLRGQTPELVVQAKLRRVLLLQTGTDPRRLDITAARVNSVTPEKRARSGWYARLEHGGNPAQFLLRGASHHGTAGKEAYVDLTCISTIRKDMILRRTGQLTEDEMREVSERLLLTLELDISEHLRRLREESE